MKMWCCGLVVSVLVAVSWAKPTDKTENVEFRMPNVKPQKKDTYLCNPMKVGKTKYITGFVPHGNMSVAHHMLLYGCKEPGYTDKTWNCGEMSSSGETDKTYPMAPTCKSGFSIVYAWAMDAPALKLPPGVGFKVGGDSDIQWLVLQVHYKNVDKFVKPKNGTDHSGITMKMTKTRQPKTAGVYLMVTGGMLPAKSTVYMEVACEYTEPGLVLHPFAYRVHAHTHGQVTAGYRVRNNIWTEIGRESPQKPQMFYNVTTPGIDVRAGDILAARCTMVNKENRDIKIGATQNDEMCNFYMMFWVSGDKLPRQRECLSDGFPNWGFSNYDGLDASKIPSTASVVPGSKMLLKATELVNQMEKTMEDTNREMEDEIEDFLSSLNGGMEDEEEPNNQILQRDLRGDNYRDLRDQQYDDNIPYDLYGNF